MQRITGPGIQREGPLGLQSMGQPTAPVAQRFRMGMKHRASALPLQQRTEAGGIPPVREVHRDAAGGGDPSRRQFGGHATAAPTPTISGNGFEGIQLPRMMHIRDRAGIRHKARIRRIETVHIGEQDQLISIDGRGHEGRQGVVVSEAELSRGNGVVFIDHRQHTPLQQLFQRSGGVLVSPPVSQIRAGHEDLRHSDAMACQRPLVQSHELALAGGRRRLQGDNGLWPLGKLKPLTTETDGSAADQNDPITPGKGSGDTGGEAINRCSGVSPQQTRAQLHHPQRHAVGAPIQPAKRRSNRCTRSWGQGEPSTAIGRTNTV